MKVDREIDEKEPTINCGYLDLAEKMLCEKEMWFGEDEIH